MRGLKDFTDEECGHTDQAWERSEALVVMIGVGLNMASKTGPNARCRSLYDDFSGWDPKALASLSGRPPTPKW